ncbi:hypothetical protein SBRY_100117 [Actinacidiphila bryophytorum]|uniref:Uncharacterized protein n=1 Tax=Actinacidiphila bryophytorum TaxID=1436133 RepID=A0A9W4E3T6_9ACTN|nr:hypothetical protein SBRY_100117 [Actinacidiphila bryophytorum]
MQRCREPAVARAVQRRRGGAREAVVGRVDDGAGDGVVLHDAHIRGTGGGDAGEALPPADDQRGGVPLGQVDRQRAGHPRPGAADQAGPGAAGVQQRGEVVQQRRDAQRAADGGGPAEPLVEPRCEEVGDAGRRKAAGRTFRRQVRADSECRTRLRRPRAGQVTGALAVLDDGNPGRGDRDGHRDGQVGGSGEIVTHACDIDGALPDPRNSFLGNRIRHSSHFDRRLAFDAQSDQQSRKLCRMEVARQHAAHGPSRVFRGQIDSCQKIMQNRAPRMLRHRPSHRQSWRTVPGRLRRHTYDASFPASRARVTPAHRRPEGITDNPPDSEAPQFPDH